MRSLAFVLLTLFIPLPCLAAPVPGELSPELSVLQRRVGTWDNVNIVKPGAWNPKGSKTEAIETIGWTMGHAFIEGHAIDSGTGVRNTHLMSWDPASKQYLFWYFDSTGNCPQSQQTGKWDEAAQTLSFTAQNPDGVVVNSALKFVGKDRIDWGATFTAKDGAVLLDMTATQTRRIPRDAVPMPLVEPSKDAAPDPNGPPELRRLTGFIGDWNASVRDNTAPQPVWTPADSNHKSWTLGGRFVRDEVRNEKKELVMLGLWTFDPVAKKHREWYFRADGDVLEIDADWDEAKSTLNINGKIMRGGTIRGPRRVTGVDSYTWDAVIRGEAGQILADLSGRQERMKP